MRTTRINQVLTLVTALLIMLASAACGNTTENTQVAIAVALTQTAVALTQPAPTAATSATPSPLPATTATQISPVAAMSATPQGQPSSVTTTPTAQPQANSQPSSPEAAGLETVAANNFGIIAQSKSGGIAGVRAFKLDTGGKQPALWTVYTYGMRSFDPQQDHIVAIYTNDQSGWHELARLVLNSNGSTAEPAPDYLSQDSVRQVFVEPTRIWLEIKGGVGAHSGTYHLIDYDGHTLHIEAAHFSSSPNAASLADLNGDGDLEVLLDNSEYYVFCYACGVKLVQYDILRWDGAHMVPVTLTQLPDTAPEQIRTLNDRAVALATAGLWKEALDTINQIQPDANALPALIWNATYIRLNAQAKRAILNDDTQGYPLLENIFYGDYAAAVDLMRTDSVEQIFGSPSPLVTGTVAEGWAQALSQWINSSANKALQTMPDLAPAYYLRAWGTFLVDPKDPSIDNDIARAAKLAPKDQLFADSLTYRRSRVQCYTKCRPAGHNIYTVTDPATQ